MAVEEISKARVLYGKELRSRREAAGLTQEQLSQRAFLSRTHLAHMEAGRRLPSPEDAERLDRVLDTGGFFARFLPVLDEEHQIAEYFEAVVEFEKQATVLRHYDPKLIPGLLQTEAYAREVLSSGFPLKSEEERDRLLVTRLKRARILDNFESPVMWVLLDEAALRRPVGSPALMAEQLLRVVEFGERRRVRVHVLPFSAGYHALLEGLVSLMWFEDLPPIAYTEGLKSGRLWENPSAVRDFQAAYDHAPGDALSHRESLALIRSVAEEYEHEAQ
ncbi:Scr1 family TA system antitoxin-like transcriptional regulator [Streptomyces sp. NPDC087218]|uniref:helix-turn-helix domain-containing protein n=1 Tax=Streptomyces sp. NPDC087218 TaxID=3365769 RepID=UPI0037FE4D7E